MEFPEGLGLAVICEREDPLDAFVSNDYQYIEQLPLALLVLPVCAVSRRSK